jgi:hypothetical protein
VSVDADREHRHVVDHVDEHEIGDCRRRIVGVPHTVARHHVVHERFARGDVARRLDQTVGIERDQRLVRELDRV